MADPVFPTPEQLQQRLNEFLRTQWGDKQTQGATAETDPPETETKEPLLADILDFNLTPRDIKRHLDRFVIRQDEAKKVLAVAVCDHYQHAKYLAQLQKDGGETGSIEYAKQNVLLVGPTGVGKTYLIKHVADRVGVPFVKADATKFSETGYVGGDVDDLVRELVQKADGNLELAEHGIIYIDEIDKIAAMTGASGRDVSGRGVQTTLLKLMEETEVPLRNPMDLQAQLQAAMDFQRRGGKPQRESINTRHILFIVSGAFGTLSDQIARRLSQSQIGFSAEPRAMGENENLLRQMTTRDLVDFGMEPEFVGRLPVRVVCDPLTPNDLFEILMRSEGSLIRQYERAFRSYGIEASFDEAALRRIADLASAESTGARGLLTVCERLLRHFKYELPGSGVSRLEINETLMDEPEATLAAVLESGKGEKEISQRKEALAFAREFAEQKGVEVEFDDSAVERLLEKSRSTGASVRELCALVLKDYEFGLKLIQKNNGRNRFVLGAAAIDDPDGVLSNWVVESYKDAGASLEPSATNVHHPPSTDSHLPRE